MEGRHFSFFMQTLNFMNRIECILCGGLLSLQYLEDHIPWQQPPITSNHPFSVNVLDEDSHQRGLVAPDDADGQRL